MENRSLTLFSTDFTALLDLKKTQIEKEIEEIKKLSSFRGSHSSAFKKSLFTNLKIGSYPVLGNVTNNSILRTITEEQAQKLIPGFGFTSNQKSIEIRYIKSTIQLNGEGLLMQYDNNTKGALNFNGALYSDRLELDFYLAKTGSEQQQAENFKAQRNNRITLLKTRMSYTINSFNSMIKILKEDINYKIDKEFKSIDDSISFDRLIDN